MLQILDMIPFLPPINFVISLSGMQFKKLRRRGLDDHSHHDESNSDEHESILELDKDGKFYTIT